MDWNKILYLPEQAGLYSKAVDHLYIFMLIVSVFFTVLVVAISIILAIKYRSREGHKAEPVHGNLTLELTWTGIPLVIVLFMFGWGTLLYFKQAHIPANAEEIFVVGKQWMWKIQHAEGPREMNELHIPVGRPVKLTMTSEDVIHSFFIPAFRTKMDVVPGKYSFMWFQATKPGKYHLFCAEYCGTKHSEMTGYVYALEETEYKQWLEERAKSPTTALVFSDPKNPNVQSLKPFHNSGIAQQNIVTLANNIPHESAGQKLFTELKCLSCHNANSGPMGPDLAGLFGRKVSLETGPTVTADETYIRESILNPSEKIARGYQALMPTYKGQIDEQQILSLVAYIKSLTDQKS